MTIWGGYTPTIGAITSDVAGAINGSGSSGWSTGKMPGVADAVSSGLGAGGVTTWNEGVLQPHVESSEPDTSSGKSNDDPWGTTKSDDISNAVQEAAKDAVNQPVFDPSKLDLGPVGGGSKGYVRDDGTVGPTPENGEVKKDTIRSITQDKMENDTKKMDNVYRPMGDDYDIDTDAAFAAAQAGTGDNQLASSISGSSSGGKGTQNSNVNDGMFGGQSNKANPGYSLW